MEEDAPSGRRRLIVGVGLVAVAAAAVVAWIALRDTGVATQAARDTSTSAPRPPVAVDPATIAVAATSTLPDVGRITYGARNTLDGDPTTAWNHGSVGDGVGEALTYTFAEPVELAHVVVVNGYSFSEEVFRRNSRIREATLTTDSGSERVALEDSRAPQQLSGDFGLTRTFRIEIASIYPGEVFDGQPAYDDVGLSEVDFFVVPRD